MTRHEVRERQIKEGERQGRQDCGCSGDERQMVDFEKETLRW